MKAPAKKQHPEAPFGAIALPDGTHYTFKDPALRGRALYDKFLAGNALLEGSETLSAAMEERLLDKVREDARSAAPAFPSPPEPPPPPFVGPPITLKAAAAILDPILGLGAGPTGWKTLQKRIERAGHGDPLRILRAGGTGRRGGKLLRDAVEYVAAVFRKAAPAATRLAEEQVDRSVAAIRAAGGGEASPDPHAELRRIAAGLE